jgi:hypothetical protein
MKLPFDRDRMRERNLLDDIDEIEQAARLTPEERFTRALDLCEFSISLSRANPERISEPSEALDEKARLWTLGHRGIAR